MQATKSLYVTYFVISQAFHDLKESLDFQDL